MDISLTKPPLDSATRKKNRITLAVLVGIVLANVTWAMLFLQKHGFNLDSGSHY